MTSTRKSRSPAVGRMPGEAAVAAVDAAVERRPDAEVLAFGDDAVHLDREAVAEDLREAEVGLVGVGLLGPRRGHVRRDAARLSVGELVGRQRLADLEEAAVGVADARRVVVRVDLAERRLGADHREQDVRVGVGEVVVAAHAAAEDEAAVTLDVVGEAGPRRDVVRVLLRRLAEVLEAGAGAGQPARAEHAALGGRRAPPGR